MEQNQFWSLLARKLAGEASLRDLYELEKAISAQPQLQFWARLTNDLWKKREEIEKEPEGIEKFFQILKEAHKNQYSGSLTKAHKRRK